MIRAVVNADFYTGDGVIHAKAMLINNDRIQGFCDEEEIPESAQLIDAGGLNVAPGFIDCQVIGAAGLKCAATASLGDMAAVARALADGGTTRWLPTVRPPAQGDFLQAAVLGQDQAKRLGILGVHLDRPPLALSACKPRQSGATELITDEVVQIIRRIASTCSVVLTLTPEKEAFHERVQEIASSGVAVCMGMDDCTYEHACGFFASWGRGLSHTVKGMTEVGTRRPNAVCAALDSRTAYLSIVNDESYIHPSVLRLLKRSARPDALFFVSDCMPLFGFDADELVADGQAMMRSGRTVVDSAGELVGSAFGLAHCIRQAIQSVGIPMDEALRMATLYPARFLSLETDFGALRAGAVADCVAFDNQINVHWTMRAGESVEAASDPIDRANQRRQCGEPEA